MNIRVVIAFMCIWTFVCLCVRLLFRLMCYAACTQNTIPFSNDISIDCFRMGNTKGHCQKLITATQTCERMRWERGFSCIRTWSFACTVCTMQCHFEWDIWASTWNFHFSICWMNCWMGNGSISNFSTAFCIFCVHGEKGDQRAQNNECWKNKVDLLQQYLISVICMLNSISIFVSKAANTNRHASGSRRRSWSRQLWKILRGKLGKSIDKTRIWRHKAEKERLLSSYLSIIRMIFQFLYVKSSGQIWTKSFLRLGRDKTARISFRQ